MENKLLNWKIPKNIKNQLDNFTNNGNVVVTRFPPEPSGYLHIGHIKALLINTVLAKRFGGKLILRFDDTNPSTENIEYEQSIQEDINNLEIYPYLITHTSDYFENLIQYAEYLIEHRLAYVDNTPQEQIKIEREEKINSVNRDKSPEANMNDWNNMKKGINTDSILRMKIDMQHKNNVMRDPTIFRTKDLEHARTGNKFKVYPTYDFACPIVDYLEGVTHVYRSTEFGNRDEQYIHILNVFNLTPPYLGSYGKLEIQDFDLSKRKIKDLISRNIIEGWDDPRLLTLRGAFRGGIHPNALFDYIEKIGFSKNKVNMTAEMLQTTNKKYIDKCSTRYTALRSNNLLNIRTNDTIEIKSKLIPKFVRSPNMGTREIIYTNNIFVDKSEYNECYTGEEITLINWGNIFVQDDNIFMLNLDGDFKSTSKKILWLCNSDENANIKIKILKYNGMDNPPEISYYLGEPDMINIKRGEFVQLLRMEYYICDKPYDDKSKYLTLIEINS